MGFSHVHHPDGPHNTLFSQGCILENGCRCDNGGKNMYSKDMCRGEVPPSALAQLTGQPTDASS